MQIHGELLACKIVQVRVASALALLGRVSGTAVPVPPATTLVSGEIHIVIVNAQICLQIAHACAECQIVKAGVLHPTLIAQAPSQGERRREAQSLARGKLSRPWRGQGCVDIVSLSIIVRSLQAQIGIAGSVISTRLCCLIAIGHEDRAQVVHTAESAVIVEVCIERDGLRVCGATDVLDTRLLVYRVVVVQSHDDILAIDASPCRLISGIGVIKRSGVSRGIVDSHHRVEAQSAQKGIEFDVDAGIELKLSRSILICAGCVLIRENVRCVELCATEDILTVDDVGRALGQTKCAESLRINHVDRYQGCQTIGSQSSSLCPEVFIARVIGSFVIAVGGIGIDISIDRGIDVDVDIAAHMQLVAVSVLGLAEVHQCSGTLVFHISVELSTVVTALDFCGSLCGVISLLDIVRAVEVDARIAIRVETRSIVIDLFCRIERLQSVIGASLVIECHVLCRPQILRKGLDDIPSRIQSDVDVQSLVDTSALACDQDSALCGAAAVECHSLCAFQESDALDLFRPDGCSLAGHTINQDQLSCITPHAGPVESGDHAVHVVKAISSIVFVCQLSDVDTCHASHDVFLGHLSERHVNERRVAWHLRLSGNNRHQRRHHGQGSA